MSYKVEKLVLQAAIEREKHKPHLPFMTQPVGDTVVEYDWARTMDEARRMAAYLRSLDLPDNSNIAMVSKNCAHFVITELAIWLAGHCTVALYPTLTADTVSYILEHSEARLLFVGKLDDWELMRPGVPADMPKIGFSLAPEDDYQPWDEVIASVEPITDDPVWPGDRRALICYTSGSTGRPKGVMHSFDSISAPAYLQGDLFGITEGDRVLSYLPLAHVFERAVVEAGSIYQGVHIFFADSLDSFMRDMLRARPTLFLSVPRLWQKFQSGVFQKFPEKKLARLLKIPLIGRMISKKVLDGLGLGEVRVALSGSAPLPPDLIRWYDKLGLAIMEGYGMTEDFAYSHLSLPGSRKPGYVGKPLTGVISRISESGEIELKSPGLMMGYYKSPDLTAEVMTEDGFFKTGDRGTYDEDGLLRITGRVKELFKTSKGKYIAPAPIENLLNAHHFVELSCVCGAGRPACFAMIQLTDSAQARYDDPALRREVETELAELVERVNARIEEFEHLKFVALAREPWTPENGFLTPTLKIKRDVIESTYEPFLDSWYAAGKRVIWQD
ncbi:AMP-binding acetyl-CoA synthetase [Mangrovimicrobium sediminis]|uniref:AMP-binding acetyl-CoA synthetase n=1 Tax=Mangrovimicrobium sediminis TaxID=2562682 RepID=A0A4Z0M5M8_9GAMM|nr:AMP-binding protein [Haliea sp. SAOS-164]TGD74794.1 AMP-binding acetyl-CoA synthetase [Haliea sp. SAOS-164]